MEITREFLAAEISDLERELQKATIFIHKAQGAIEAYRLMLNKLDAPVIETVGEKND